MGAYFSFYFIPMVNKQFVDVDLTDFDDFLDDGNAKNKPVSKGFNNTDDDIEDVSFS